MAAALKVRDERELAEPDYRAVAEFASAPCPPLPKPSEEDLGKIVTALAAALKKAATAPAKGRFQMALYWRALHDLELFRIEHAAEHFLLTGEWMPTPGEMRTQALHYVHPVQLAHARALRFVRNRDQRLHLATVRAIRDRTLAQDQLDRLPDEAKQAGLALMELVPTPEGGVTYRTREALERWLEHSRALMVESRKDG